MSERTEREGWEQQRDSFEREHGADPNDYADAHARVFDLWEYVRCSRCGALPGELCVTRNGVRTARSHAVRRVAVTDDAAP